MLLESIMGQKTLPDSAKLHFREKIFTSEGE
jgi:hypothetical protein